MGQDKNRPMLKRQGTNVNIRQMEGLYPTIDEQESKEESMGQTSTEINVTKKDEQRMNNFFYSKPPKLVEKEAPKTNINRRFKSKMLSLFD